MIVPNDGMGKRMLDGRKLVKKGIAVGWGLWIAPSSRWLGQRTNHRNLVGKSSVVWIVQNC